jgi:hypothetical protein
MTLLYGKDANGNQVPLLVSSNGTVQTSGLWSGTSSQLTAGDGSAVTVGSGLTLAGATLSASGSGPATVFDCDFSALSNASLTNNVPVVITDQSSRSLTFTPSYVGTASGSIVNGSGVAFTTASNGARAKFRTPMAGFSRYAIGAGYRAWIRWNSYSPLSTTANLFTGMQLIFAAGIDGVSHWRQNQVNWYAQNIADPYQIGNFTPWDVLVLEQNNGFVSTYVGYWSSGWPTLSSMRCFVTGYGGNINTSFWRNVDLSTSFFEPQFANLNDSTSRTMYMGNMKIETF